MRVSARRGCSPTRSHFRFPVRPCSSSARVMTAYSATLSGSVLPASPNRRRPSEPCGARVRGTAPASAVLHELVGENIVKRFGPQMPVGAHRRCRSRWDASVFRDGVTGVIVVAGLVVQISAKRVVVDPRGEGRSESVLAARRPRPARRTASRRRARENGPYQPHRIAGVVAHRQKDGGAGGVVAVPLMAPIERSVSRRAAELVPDLLVVVQQRPPVEERLIQVLRVSLRLVRETRTPRAAPGQLSPSAPPRSLVVLRMVDRPPDTA